MTTDEANAIYDILVRECGADNPLRFRFLDYIVAVDSSREWRFQGKLGFGGKFYAGCSYAPHRVSCYDEDETPERRRMIERANEALGRIGR